MTAAALTTPVLGGGGRWTHKGYFEDDEDEEEEDYSGLEDWEAGEIYDDNAMKYELSFFSVL